MTILEMRDLHVSFGGIRATDGVSLSIERGELLGLIGPNGAGKTTLIRLLCGILRPDRGAVLLRGTDVTKTATEKRVRLGLALTHQIVRPFRNLTVIENVMLAAGMPRTGSAVRSLFEFRRGRERQQAEQILEKLGLAEIAKRQPGELPLGQLKRLEVARALALNPEILLLDEPLAGLNQREAAFLAETIVALNQSDLTIILVEHNLAEVLRVSSRLAVLDRGRLIAEGPAAAVINRPEVRDAYIGSREGSHA